MASWAAMWRTSPAMEILPTGASVLERTQQLEVAFPKFVEAGPRLERGELRVIRIGHHPHRRPVFAPHAPHPADVAVLGVEQVVENLGDRPVAQGLRNLLTEVAKQEPDRIKRRLAATNQIRGF